MYDALVARIALASSQAPAANAAPELLAAVATLSLSAAAASADLMPEQVAQHVGEQDSGETMLPPAYSEA
jgi:hypothetical protein